MLRIILSVVMLGSILYVALPMWKMLRRMEEISCIFENSFDIYPEERKEFFSRNYSQEIICGKTRFIFSNMKEACSEFEKCINNLFEYYEKHDWIVNLDIDLQLNKEKLIHIAKRVYCLKVR